MTSSIHFHFKTAPKVVDSIEFQGPSLSALMLKEKISQKKLSSSGANLIITNVASRKEYKDTDFVPKNSLVEIRRAPVTRPRDVEIATVSLPEKVDSKILPAPELSKPPTVSQNATNSAPAPPQSLPTRKYGRPPPSYVCHKCKIPGHWLQSCPSNPQTRTELHPNPPPVPADLKIKARSPEGEDVPSCPLCSKPFVNPMATQCCFRTFCNECICQALVVAEFVCPICHEPNVTPETLQPNLGVLRAATSAPPAHGGPFNPNEIFHSDPNNKNPTHHQPSPSLYKYNSNDPADSPMHPSVIRGDPSWNSHNLNTDWSPAHSVANRNHSNHPNPNRQYYPDHPNPALFHDYHNNFKNPSRAPRHDAAYNTNLPNHPHNPLGDRDRGNSNHDNIPPNHLPNRWGGGGGGLVKGSGGGELHTRDLRDYGGTHGWGENSYSNTGFAFAPRDARDNTYQRERISTANDGGQGRIDSDSGGFGRGGRIVDRIQSRTGPRDHDRSATHLSSGSGSRSGRSRSPPSKRSRRSMSHERERDRLRDREVSREGRDREAAPDRALDRRHRSPRPERTITRHSGGNHGDDRLEVILHRP
jgi:hypothetical protein